MTTQLFTSKREDHYTPVDIADRIRYVFGGTIDLDPASSSDANKVIKARRYYADVYASENGAHELTCLTDPAFGGFNGLQQSWHAANVWLNPPFSIVKRDAGGNPVYKGDGKAMRERVIADWVKRWRNAITDPCTYSGEDADPPETTEAALLVPARVDTQWFVPLFGLAMCFINGRLHFSNADNGATFPSVIVYYGPNTGKFFDIFEEIGECGSFHR